ncbi:MAG: preprotein translocase subunit SecY, partial [Microbacteriaceae bacterium]|nr:preprotein translocase subunit SecY [Microbacteriaceae bacterium]
MFSAIMRAFSTPDLRNKLLFTLAIVAIYRLGSFIPAPFVNYGVVKECLNADGASVNGIYELVN